MPAAHSLPRCSEAVEGATPASAASVLAGRARTVRETTTPAAAGGLDLPGQLLGALALSLLAAGAIEGGGDGFSARVTGGVFGVAVLGALLSAGGGQGVTHGLHAALIAAAAVALAGAALTAALIPGRPPTGGPPRG